MILRSGATLPKGVWPGSRDATGEPLFFVLLRCFLLHSVNQNEEHHYCENAGNDPDSGNVVHFFTSTRFGTPGAPIPLNNFRGLAFGQCMAELLSPGSASSYSTLLLSCCEFRTRR